MAGLLARRTFTVMRFRQPCRLKSWCQKEKENKEAIVKHASQESLYKDYDLNRCKKTVFCPMSRLDCYKQEQKAPPPCGKSKKKMTVTDALGKLIWICLKGGVVIALVYVTVDAGLWKSPDETYEIAKTIYKRVLETLGLDDSRKLQDNDLVYRISQCASIAGWCSYQERALSECEDGIRIGFILKSLGTPSLARMPTAAEIMYNTVQVWNKGVRIIFNRIVHPYVDYDTYMARLRARAPR